MIARFEEGSQVPSCICMPDYTFIVEESSTSGLQEIL